MLSYQYTNEQMMNNSASQPPLKLIKPYPTRSLRQYLAHRSIHSSQCLQQSPQAQLQIEIHIGDGRTQLLQVDSCTDIEASAQDICKRHQLEPFVSDLLAKSIRQQYQRQSLEQEHQRQAQIIEELRQIYAQNSAQEVLLSHNNSSQKFIEQEYLGNTFASHQKCSLWRRSQSEQQNKQNKSSMNAVSRRICQKYGKQNILKSKEKRSRQKMEVLKRQKISRENAELQECLFHPKINAISQKVDEEIFDSSVKNAKKTDRHQLLYQNFQEQKTKRQRQKYKKEAQHNFKPNINSISRLIVEGRRQSDHLAFSKQSAHSHCKGSDSKQNRPKTGRKPENRNKEGLPIGEYLYKQGKRQSKPEVFNVNNEFKALQYSEFLVSTLKQKKLKQIFIQLSKPPHQLLSPSDIPSSYQLANNSVRLMLPLFQQIQQLGVELSQQNFIQAGLKLIDSLTPEQRHELMFKKDGLNSSSNYTSSQSRGISRQVSGDLYAKGKKKELQKEIRLQQSREEKARQQLKQCTFRPILNR